MREKLNRTADIQPTRSPAQTSRHRNQIGRRGRCQEAENRRGQKTLLAATRGRRPPPRVTTRHHTRTAFQNSPGLALHPNLI